MREPTRHTETVRDASGLWATDMDAGTILLEGLRQHVPGLDSVLATL